MTSSSVRTDRNGARVLTALGQRLRAVAGELVTDVPAPRPVPAEDAAELLQVLVEAVRTSGRNRDLWLLWTAMAAAFPTGDELLEARRRLQLTDPDGAVAHLLSVTYTSTLNSGTPEAELELVRSGVVVDVDFCATSDHHTGIQRVVRETVPRWTRDHDLTLVAWTSSHGCTRELVPREEQRVLRWSEVSHRDTSREQSTAIRPTVRPAPRLLVPWECVVVFPENPEPQRCAAISALAQWSGNTITAIGYDCIPVVSPELIHPGLPDRFVAYLSAMKHARTIAGISASATEEFRGFADMMPSQGLVGPEVVEVALPAEVPPLVGDHPGAALPPLVMCVGSFEPRKNQLAVLHAAERLWREGLTFSLRFIGGGGYRTEFETEMSRLLLLGRDVSVSVRMTDEQLWSTYAGARFSVFASLHEGYGLPVAESLAHGTPALTTSYGSTAEIAAEGGALTVDPKDDDALTDGMRAMLTDDDLVARLRAEIARRPVRTWDDYAAESWLALTGPPAPEPTGARA